MLLRDQKTKKFFKWTHKWHKSGLMWPLVVIHSFDKIKLEFIEVFISKLVDKECARACLAKITKTWILWEIEEVILLIIEKNRIPKDLNIIEQFKSIHGI